jgi:hypothetical protein
MAIGRRRDASQTRPIHAPARVEDVKSYLERWRALDERLLTRTKAPLVCFGAGEAAGLLRAYAPRVWSWVRACTADAVPAAKGGESRATFGELPLIPLDSVKSDETVLVGVRPADQAQVARRLGTRFTQVVTWYDLIDEPRV